MALSGYMPTSGIAGSYHNSTFSFLRNLHTVLHLILWPPDAKNWLIWKDPDAGKDWRQEEKETTGLDCWMALPAQLTWVWINSRSWWWTRSPGILQSMGSQRVGHDWATGLNWTELNWIFGCLCLSETTVTYHLTLLKMAIIKKICI